MGGVVRLMALLAVAWLVACADQRPANPPPALRAQGEAVQLIVDGAPFLILGGELGNSSASDPNEFDDMFARLAALNLNTVLAPVSWELIEPEEGRFDFEIVDRLLGAARAHDLRLVLLWFGSWKNSMSTYAPVWVKRDTARFPRARDEDGVAQEILSPFYENNWQADAKAFAALMAHLRESDAHDRTVLMVQVENEIGMLPSARDHSEAANAAASDVPRNAAAEERFMAAAFASYVEHVAAAGKQAYSIPMYVNAALNRPGALPGQYPSAGPLPHLHNIWRANAPSIDFLAPDIYFEDYSDRLAAYDRAGEARFIPEANRAGRAQSAADAFVAFAAHDAIGYSPFSIDSLSAEDDAGLAQAYDALRQLAPLILGHQGQADIKRDMAGFRPRVSYAGYVDDTVLEHTFGEYAFHISFIDPWTPRTEQNIGAHGGLVIQMGADDFLVAGQGVTITFTTANEQRVGIESAVEGVFENGNWRAGRRLNGDQTHQGRHIRLPPGDITIQRVRLYRYN